MLAKIVELGSASQHRLDILMARQTAIPCILMRGGTSKGPYFIASDLPTDTEIRDAVLLAAMGSPDPSQLDGIGGAQTLTSKAAIISPSEEHGVDVDYLLAQVSIDKKIVDTTPSCGNMLAGVGPFAIETGLVLAHHAETFVRIRNVNTGSIIEALVQTPDGQVTYEGDAAIDGVPGTAAPILLRFKNIIGSKTQALLPTGHLQEEIDGLKVTCIDVAVPMVMMRACDLGKTGYESKMELDADSVLLQRLEVIRRQAGQRMRLGDVRDKVIPKIALLARPRWGGTLTSRYFVPQNCHMSHAVTGAICIATCTLMHGTVAEELSEQPLLSKQERVKQLKIEHPSGQIHVEIAADGQGTDLQLHYGGVIRTARRLFQGEILVPTSVWDGKLDKDFSINRDDNLGLLA